MQCERGLGYSGERIRVLTSRDAQGRAVVEALDKGPGIPAEVLARVFDPFSTIKPTGVQTGYDFLSIATRISIASRANLEQLCALVRRSTR